MCLNDLKTLDMLCSEHPGVLHSSLGFDLLLEKCLLFSSTLEGLAIPFKCTPRVSKNKREKEKNSGHNICCNFFSIIFSASNSKSPSYFSMKLNWTGNKSM